MSEKIIIQYLENISGQMDKISTEIRDIKQDVRVLDEKGEKLTARIDEVEETLNRRIDAVEEKLTARIDEVEETLNEKIDLVEKALDTEIDSVYKIACENKQNIELLLIPFNDRNMYMSAEVSKIPELDERLDEVEDKVGQHSEAIRKLKAALAV